MTNMFTDGSFLKPNGRISSNGCGVNFGSKKKQLPQIAD